jgi:biopolymer transport protein TolQ
MIKGSGVSIMELVQQADVIVQSVMIILLIASMWSWSIAFDKVFKFHVLKIKTNRFEELFATEKLDNILAVAQRNNDHPFARIFLAAMKEWKANNIKIIMQGGEDKKNSLKDRISSAMQIAAIKSTEKLESSMHLLAITGSVAPFIGLFGTVWGIMNSFQGIAISKNTSLAVVAPGIAEALLATAIGLFAAIPAVFFYNIYENKISQFSDRMNSFSVTIMNVLSRELDRQ